MNKIRLTLQIALFFLVTVKGTCQQYFPLNQISHSEYNFNKINSFNKSSFMLYGFDSIAYYKKMLDYNKNGMFVLGSWAAINIVSGVYFKRNTTLDALKYFHEANVLWNIVNLGLATSGLYSYSKNYHKHFTLSKLLFKQHNYEKIYLFNAGLDVGYYFLGRYLNEKADNSSNTAQLSGYGTSLMLQAAFLFAFDLGMYYIHHRHSKNKLYKSF